MTRAEEKKYYAEYNSKYAQKQWDSISKLNRQGPAQSNGKQTTALPSVSFSIKNKSV